MISIINIIKTSHIRRSTRRSGRCLSSRSEGSQVSICIHYIYIYIYVYTHKYIYIYIYIVYIYIYILCIYKHIIMIIHVIVLLLWCTQSYISKGIWRQGKGSVARNSYCTFRHYALSSYALTCARLMYYWPRAPKPNLRSSGRKTGGEKPSTSECQWCAHQ